MDQIDNIYQLYRVNMAFSLENFNKGFTVLQAVVLAENDGLRSPYAYGIRDTGYCQAGFGLYQRSIIL